MNNEAIKRNNKGGWLSEIKENEKEKPELTMHVDQHDQVINAVNVADKCVSCALVIPKESENHKRACKMDARAQSRMEEYGILVIEALPMVRIWRNNAVMDDTKMMEYRRRIQNNNNS